MIGFAFCGSFCTVSAALRELEDLAREKEIQGIVSEAIYQTNTRFSPAAKTLDEIRKITGRGLIHTIVEAEPLGPKQCLEALIICPCTGNTLAKIANGITDSTVSMAAKAHLRSDRPLVIALASNDALSANLKNIAELLNRKNVYFVPMKQDDPISKPHSLVADFSQLQSTLEAALRGEQRQPIFQT